MVQSKKVRKTRKSNSKNPGFVDEGMDDMEEMDSDSLNNSFEQLQKRVRIDISPHDDGMSGMMIMMINHQIQVKALKPVW